MMESKNKRLYLFINLAFGGYPIALVATYHELGAIFSIAILFSGYVAAFGIKELFSGWKIIYATVVYGLICICLNSLFGLLSHDVIPSIVWFAGSSSFVQILMCSVSLVFSYLPHPLKRIKGK